MLVFTLSCIAVIGFPELTTGVPLVVLLSCRQEIPLQTRDVGSCRRCLLMPVLLTLSSGSLTLSVFELLRHLLHEEVSMFGALTRCWLEL